MHCTHIGHSGLDSVSQRRGTTLVGVFKQKLVHSESVWSRGPHTEEVLTPQGPRYMERNGLLLLRVFVALACDSPTAYRVEWQGGVAANNIEWKGQAVCPRRGGHHS